MKQMCWSLLIVLAATSLFAQSRSVNAAMPQTLIIPPQAQPSAHFDAEAATQAYLAQMPAEARARSDAYFVGGYWLLLWDFLYGAVIALLLLQFRWSARMRGVAERMTRLRPLQTAIYWFQYILLTTILGFPLAVYEGYFREHKYGLATRTFGPWMFDQFKGLLLTVVFGALLTMALFGIARMLPRTWWLWGALVTSLFLVIGVLIGPVYILPLFNKVSRLDDPVLTQRILRLARANGIPASDVFKVDASRQTTRMSANVSGLGNTLRITLNDNLLRRGSPEEIEAVMGHEMGHYVLNHIEKGIFFFVVLIVTWFAALFYSLQWALQRWGARWEIRGIGDTAVLPLVVLITSIFF